MVVLVNNFALIASDFPKISHMWMIEGVPVTKEEYDRHVIQSKFRTAARLSQDDSKKIQLMMRLKAKQLAKEELKKENNSVKMTDELSKKFEQQAVLDQFENNDNQAGFLDFDDLLAQEKQAVNNPDEQKKQAKVAKKARQKAARDAKEKAEAAQNELEVTKTIASFLLQKS